ncbi:DMT family transporter [Bacillus sp. FJAT-45350]|uniref:DMT family transporter n=1 Tax=Bacillus sp. FJAT-45350 TaxID=2011014 RepID=UPI000BB8A420|nr:DMT family transporter [Bacillus sp. FJAT-45350]
MKNEKSIILTYGLIGFVMVIWGLNVVMLKVLVEYLPPATMQSLRIFVAGLVVCAILFFQKQFRPLTKKEWKVTIITTLLGVVGHHLFLAIGLSMTTASNTSLILALLPLTTSLFALLLLNDQLTRLRLVGICFGLVGVGLIILNGSGGVGSINYGDLFVFLAMLVQALSFIYIKKATATIDSKFMTGIMLIIGSSMLFLISLVLEPGGLGSVVNTPGYVWAIFFASAIVATAIGHILFNSAIQRIGAGQTAVFNNFVPFFGLVSSAIFLGEQIMPVQMIGFVIIVFAVLLGTGYADDKILRKVKKKQAA